jgi:hypothetical protein
MASTETANKRMRKSNPNTPDIMYSCMRRKESCNEHNLVKEDLKIKENNWLFSLLRGKLLRQAKSFVW